MAAYEGGEEYTVSGTGTLGGLRSIESVTGYAGCQLVNAFSGTIQCQVSFDAGVTFVAIQIVNMADGTTSTGITAAGVYRADVGSMRRFRWQCSAYTSGTPLFYPSKVRG